MDNEGDSLLRNPTFLECSGDQLTDAINRLLRIKKGDFLVIGVVDGVWSGGGYKSSGFRFSLTTYRKNPLTTPMRPILYVSSDRLSVNGARNAIKRCARDAGVQGYISRHSLRACSAVSLAQAGESVVDMQTAARWTDTKMPAHWLTTRRGAN